ncbi:MAG: ZIP family metal transporter [Methyloprofundus sp.]|nr:ZIP family metal transporter [Methyloprofundus sp.]
MSDFNSSKFFDKCQSQLESCSYYQKIQALPKNQRWMVWAALFLASQVVVFGSLYLFFGEIAAIGLFASVLAGLATGLGALPAAFFKQVSNNVFNGLLGGAAGVMLAATSFSLLIPGIEYGNELWPDKGLWVVALGMLFGAFFLHIADNKLPHIHFNEDMSQHTESLQKIWLFIFAITIHNFPEGMSVGVSFATGDIHNGIVLAIAIALQNIPEGLAVALPLVALGFNKWKAVGIATLTGLVEPIGALMGITMVSVFSPVLPFAMGFAAGAMLFVISEEIIPETHSKGRSRYATFALMIGFIIMMALESLLG